MNFLFPLRLSTRQSARHGREDAKSRDSRVTLKLTAYGIVSVYFALFPVAEVAIAQGVPSETANCRLEGPQRALSGPELPKNSAECRDRCLAFANEPDPKQRCTGYNFVVTDESWKTGYLDPIPPLPPNWMPGEPVPLPPTACQLLTGPLSFGRAISVKSSVFACIMPCNAAPKPCGMHELGIDKPEEPKKLPLVAPSNRLPPVRKEVPDDIRR